MVETAGDNPSIPPSPHPHIPYGLYGKLSDLGAWYSWT